MEYGGGVVGLGSAASIVSDETRVSSQVMSGLQPGASMLARFRLQDPDVRPGMAKELRKHVAILEREIAELEQS